MLLLVWPARIAFDDSKGIMRVCIRDGFAYALRYLMHMQCRGHMGTRMIAQRVKDAFRLLLFLPDCTIRHLPGYGAGGRLPAEELIGREPPGAAAAIGRAYLSNVCVHAAVRRQARLTGAHCIIDCI